MGMKSKNYQQPTTENIPRAKVDTDQQIYKYGQAYN